MFPSCTVDVQEQEKLDQFLLFLEKSGITEILNSVHKMDPSSGGRPIYNPCHLFATILYGFAFGVIKQDMDYDRFRRIHIDKVTSEFMLMVLGYNIRKLFRYYNGKLKLKYWKAPGDIEPEKFKKPSAKRLSNRVNKKKIKTKNQEAKHLTNIKKLCKLLITDQRFLHSPFFCGLKNQKFYLTKLNVFFVLDCSSNT